MSTATSAAAASANGPNKPSPTANVKSNRLPAPTLFVGPPSRNASHLSISRQQTHESNGTHARDPLSRGRSRNPDTASTINGNGYNGEGSEGGGAHRSIKKASEKSIEGKWKEMQSTLNEVEMTAQSSTHVFGEQHAKALDDLRRAQVELARAWGRGNQDQPGEEDPTAVEFDRFRGADELARERREVGGANSGHSKNTSRSDAGRGRDRADTATSASTALSDESLRSDVTSKSGRSQLLEDETAQDIKLASERRAANEAYFKKVEGGVREVVKKLEVVAEAMRGVEGESRSLWSGSESTYESTASEVEGEREAGGGRRRRRKGSKG